MSNIQLTVPIQTDARVVSSDITVKAQIDYSKLPLSGSNEPSVGEVIHQQGKTLSKGIHLHWQLPKNLSQGHHNTQTNQLDFPAIPNRWLVIRTGGGATQRWVVESDYIHSEGKGDSKSTAFPLALTYGSDESVPASPAKPYRYVGRQVKVTVAGGKLVADAGATALEGGQYLIEKKGRALTAIGYGNLHFAGYYPNCMGTLGFHDDTAATNTGVTYTYQILGWYSNLAHDFTKQQASELTGDSTKDIRKTFLDKFQWVIESIHVGSESFKEANIPTYPQFSTLGKELKHTLCYSNVSVKATPDVTTETPFKVAVGNTVPQALATITGKEMAQLNVSQGFPKPVSLDHVVNLLESVYLTDNIAHLSLDIGVKYEEAKHNEGFKSFAGGSLWKITPNTKHANASKSPNSAQARAHEELTLPTHLAYLLNSLNLEQSKYDRYTDALVAWRKHLYGNWSLYQLSKYKTKAREKRVDWKH